MEKEKIIPQGYMTTGEIAKKMGVTVRTLQHYNKEGLLPPSFVSLGGRRLYTDKDMIKLHQILSLKHLGFSLQDIKKRLIPLNTPDDVAGILEEQAAALRQKIEALRESLWELERLRNEVLQMQTVDFKKYADIIINLQMKNDYYWLIKHFDEQLLDHIRNRFDKESGMAFIEAFQLLQEKAIRFSQEGVAADSEQGQKFAESYWKMIMEFTGGDISMLSKLIEFGQSKNLDQNWMEKQTLANAFIEPALEVYFSKLGTDPFGGMKDA